MNTLIFNLNDTIAMSDSAVVELAKVLNACQPCIQEAETSCNDVIIVATICVAIVFVAFIAKWTILSWQETVIASNKEEREAKEKKDKEECERKQRADLHEKLLSFLEKNTSQGEYIKDKDKIMGTLKNTESTESQYYINVLKACIKKDNIPDYPINK